PHCEDKIEKILEITFKSYPNIIDFSIGLITCNLDYLEIPWIPNLQYLILYQNHFIINLENTKLDDYLEQLANSLPKYIKEIKIWIVLSDYEDEVNLVDLCKFFCSINSIEGSSVLLEIIIPSNAQVVSKSVQFDEFGKPKKIEGKNLDNLISYNTSVD
ncbi:25053_t:CDS:1, partial [Racocetra persica]